MITAKLMTLADAQAQGLRVESETNELYQQVREATEFGQMYFWTMMFGAKKINYSYMGAGDSFDHDDVSVSVPSKDMMSWNYRAHMNRGEKIVVQIAVPGAGQPHEATILLEDDALDRITRPTYRAPEIGSMTVVESIVAFRQYIFDAYQARLLISNAENMPDLYAVIEHYNNDERYPISPGSMMEEMSLLVRPSKNQRISRRVNISAEEAEEHVLKFGKIIMGEQLEKLPHDEQVDYSAILAQRSNRYTAHIVEVNDSMTVASDPTQWFMTCTQATPVTTSDKPVQPKPHRLGTVVSSIDMMLEEVARIGGVTMFDNDGSSGEVTWDLTDHSYDIDSGYYETTRDDAGSSVGQVHDNAIAELLEQ